MQWLFLGVVVAGLVVIEARLQLDWVRMAAVRNAVREERVIHRMPISAQWARGWWGRGNAKGIQLVVREHSFELAYPFPGGHFLSTEWFCRAADALMSVDRGRFLPPKVQRDCIVLSIPAIDNTGDRQEILLAPRPPRNDLREAWDALVACGVHASGDAPAST
jgi:hypothetical protein